MIPDLKISLLEKILVSKLSKMRTLVVRNCTIENTIHMHVALFVIIWPSSLASVGRTDPETPL